MRKRLARWRCRLAGHASYGHGFRSNFDPFGRPLRDGLFTIDAWCRRCGDYTGITVPDRFTIYPKALR